jgi:molybdenum cofactor cytidylyltransferase
MGAFKPLLPFGDQTVIEACIQNLRAGGVNEIVVVLGHRADEIRATLADDAVRFAINPDPDSEMSASIAWGVRELSGKARAALIALTDYPAVPPQVIASLISEYESGEATLLIPEFAGRGGHPVLIDLRYKDELLTLDPARGLRALFDAHRAEVRRVSVDSHYVARDMDTWEDYRTLHRDVFGTEPPALFHK